MVSPTHREAVAPPPLPCWALAGVAALAALNLLAALGGGLVRLGTLSAGAVGLTGPQAVLAHGALVMAGFFSTLIALERVVALRRGVWVPLLSGLGGVCGWALGAWPIAAGLWLVSATGLVSLYVWAGRHRALSWPLAIEGSGALALLAAHAAFALGHADAARLCWSAFLVLTIAGERRELNRLLRLPRWATLAFTGLWLGLLLAVGVSQINIAWAYTLWWCALGALSLWLLRFDLARHQWRARGWAGHTAVCLSVGYGWLLLAAGAGLGGLSVAWHLLWLGFVMAMVFGHAPIMLPALAGWHPLPTRAALWPLGLMGASLLLRVAGSTMAWPLGLAGAGAGHVLSLALFAFIMVRAIRRGT